MPETDTYRFDTIMAADMPFAAGIAGVLLNLEAAFARGEDLDEAVYTALMHPQVRDTMERMRQLAEAGRPLAKGERRVQVQDIVLGSLRRDSRSLHVEGTPPPGLDTDWHEDLDAAGFASEDEQGYMRLTREGQSIVFARERERARRS
jgi:hypothetical protein